MIKCKKAEGFFKCISLKAGFVHLLTKKLCFWWLLLIAISADSIMGGANFLFFNLLSMKDSVTRC